MRALAQVRDPRRERLLIHAILALVAVLFSVHYIVGKIALRSFQPLTFAYLRVLGSAICLLILTGSRKTASLPLSPADGWRLVLYSMLGVVINQLLFISGLALTTAHEAAILITTIPIFTLVSAVVLGTERLTPSKSAGILIALTGAVLLLGRGHNVAARPESLLGDALILMNCASYGLYLVLSKPLMKQIGAVRAVTRMFAIGAVIMIPFCVNTMIHEKWNEIPPAAWIALIVVILGPTVAAYVLNAWALARAESTLVAAYTYVQPFVASILATIFLGETISASIAGAAGLIFAGVYLSSRASGVEPGGMPAP